MFKRMLKEQSIGSRALGAQPERASHAAFPSEDFRRGYRAALADNGLGEEFLPSHRQVQVDTVEVDEGMAPLLRALWALGMATQFSCQGEPGRYVPHLPSASQHDAHVVFCQLEVAVTFLRQTIDLLGGCPWEEGWLELTAMQPLRGVGAIRGRVGWPPALHEEVTAVWLAHERTVPHAD